MVNRLLPVFSTSSGSTWFEWILGKDKFLLFQWDKQVLLLKLASLLMVTLKLTYQRMMWKSSWVKPGASGTWLLERSKAFSVWSAPRNQSCNQPVPRERSGQWLHTKQNRSVEKQRVGAIRSAVHTHITLKQGAPKGIVSTYLTSCCFWL